jgi:hypothetical protein
MNLIERARAILTRPKLGIAGTAAEPATTSSLVSGYAALLAALPALGMLFALILFAGGSLASGIGYALILLLLLYLLRDLGLTLLMGMVAKPLSKAFGGSGDGMNAMKLAVYAATPIWIAGFIFALLAPLVGSLAYLLLLAGFAYAGYILYLGSGPLLAVPQAQAPIFAGIMTVTWLILWFLANDLVSRIVLSMVFSGAMRGYGF